MRKSICLIWLVGSLDNMYFFAVQTIVSYFTLTLNELLRSLA